MNRYGFAFVLAFASCSAEPPEVGGDLIDARPNMGMDAGVPDEVPLLLAPLPESTYWGTTPIHGSGPPDGSVLVDTESSGALHVNISSSGNFCIDVPLRDGLNRFELTPISETGDLGDPVSAAITRSGESPPAPQPTPAQNIAMGGVITTSETVDEGDVYSVIDGDWSTMSTLSNAWLGEDWVWVLLRERSRIDRVVVVSAADCRMEKFDVMFSDDDAPGNPESTNGNWTFTEVDNSQNTWTATELSFDPFVSKHMAVRFISGDCAYWYGRGQHELAEMQAWTEADVPPPPPSAPSCSSGGI